VDGHSKWDLVRGVDGEGKKSAKNKATISKGNTVLREKKAGGLTAREEGWGALFSNVLRRKFPWGRRKLSDCSGVRWGGAT